MVDSRIWHLVERPVGLPGDNCFELRQTALPELAEGELLVENKWMALEPSMRGRIGADKGYEPFFDLGAPVSSRATGRVIESRAERFAPGDIVLHPLGWRDKAIVAAAHAMKITSGLPEPAYLGVLGGSGLTGYFGILDVAGVKAGDVVFVSGAAGCVGSTVVQLAKLKGAYVIGSAGGPEKGRWLEEIGCDAVIDYRSAPDLEAALSQRAPEGIDVYFDNVGGDHLFAAIGCAKQHARFAECGMIADYNSGYQAKPRNLMLIVAKRLRIQGFSGYDYFNRLDEFYREMTPMVRDGRVKSRETVVEGLEQAPAALRGMFQGQNIGKMVLKLH